MNNIDVYLSKRETLNLYEFVYLNLIYNKEFELADALWQEHLEFIDVYSLETLGYVKLFDSNSVTIYSESIELRDKAKSLFAANTSPKVRAELLTPQLRAIFPEGVNSGGYRYRGDKQGVYNKLAAFIKKYPKYSDEQILQATKQYVNRFKPDYVGMRQAHYFLEKGGMSDLLGELENLTETDTTTISTSSITMI